MSWLATQVAAAYNAVAQAVRLREAQDRAAARPRRTQSPWEEHRDEVEIHPAEALEQGSVGSATDKPRDPPAAPPRAPHRQAPPTPRDDQVRTIDFEA